MNDATKALVIALLNAGLGLLIAFNVILTQAQVGAVDGFANAALAAFIAITYKTSPKRG